MLSLRFVLVLATLLALSAASRNPCHSNRRTQGDKVTCEAIVLPPALCKVCKLRPRANRGNFQDCQNIYDLSDPKCRSWLRRYANLNKCDFQRNQHVKDFSNKQNVIALDYFIYSVCEECCDCIPRGAKPGEFEKRKKAGTLMKVNRANCPAHARYDVCKVWPKVRHIRWPWQKVPANLANGWPKICPIIVKWKNSPDGQKLYNKDQINQPPSMTKFLTQYVKIAKCSDKAVWNECSVLEKSQNRI